MEQIQSALVQAFVVIALALISLLAAYAVMLINKAKDKLTEETKNIKDQETRDYANEVLKKVTDALSIAVDKVESTTVKTLKAASADGKLTKEDQQLVAKEARELANEILGTDAKDLLVGVIGDTEKFIDSKIASLVISKKTGTTASSTTETLNE